MENFRNLLTSIYDKFPVAITLGGSSALFHHGIDLKRSVNNINLIIQYDPSVVEVRHIANTMIPYTDDPIYLTKERGDIYTKFRVDDIELDIVFIQSVYHHPGFGIATRAHIKGAKASVLHDLLTTERDFEGKDQAIHKHLWDLHLLEYNLHIVGMERILNYINFYEGDLDFSFFASPTKKTRKSPAFIDKAEAEITSKQLAELDSLLSRTYGSIHAIAATDPINHTSTTISEPISSSGTAKIDLNAPSNPHQEAYRQWIKSIPNNQFATISVDDNRQWVDNFSPNQSTGISLESIKAIFNRPATPEESTKE